MNRRTAVLPLSLAAGAAIAVGAGFAAGAGSSQAQKPAAPVVAQSPLVKPFVAYGDHALYNLVPGGNFTPKTADWSLTGGAELVSSATQASVSGSHGLSLASGSSASSAAFPGGGVHTIRFFAQNEGSSGSMLRVSITADENGVETQIPLGTVRGASLAPTPVFKLPEALQIAASQHAEQLRVTLTPVGSNSHWLVKDVYADPIYRCGVDC